MKNWLSLAALVLIGSCTQKATDTALVSLTDIADPVYKIGQVWRYNTRPSESNSTLTILKIEQSGLDTIVHVHISSVRLRTDTLSSSYQNMISHSPFSRAAITASVTKLVTVEQDLPEFEEGYSLWREAYLNNEGGIFSVPVNKSIENTEETFATGTKTVEGP